MNPLLLFERSKLLLSLPNYGRLIVRLYRDARVPMWLKMGGLAAAVLVLSPLDPFADIPVLNMLDDAALLMFAAKLFVGLAPAAVVAEHRIALGIAGAVAGMKNVTPVRQ